MPSNHLILCHPLFFCLQSLSASGSFLMSWLFTSGGQSTGASVSASVLLMNIQDWFLLGLTGSVSLEVQGTLKSLLQHHSFKSINSLAFSFLYSPTLTSIMTTGKTIALTILYMLEKISILSSQRLPACVHVDSVMSSSLQPHGLQPARFLCPWDFSSKNMAVGCHSLLQGISRPRDWTHVSCMGRQILLPLSHLESPKWLL